LHGTGGGEKWVQKIGRKKQNQLKERMADETSTKFTVLLQPEPFCVSVLFVVRKRTFSRLTVFELAALVVQEEWEKLGLQSRVDYENLKRVFERLDLKKDGRIDQHELAMIYKVSMLCCMAFPCCHKTSVTLRRRPPSS